MNKNQENKLYEKMDDILSKLETISSQLKELNSKFEIFEKNAKLRFSDRL